MYAGASVESLATVVIATGGAGVGVAELVLDVLEAGAGLETACGLRHR
ncbi:hypothetical protein [Micromonospora sp. NPDC023737]